MNDKKLGKKIISFLDAFEPDGLYKNFRKQIAFTPTNSVVRFSTYGQHLSRKRKGSRKSFIYMLFWQECYNIL